MGDDTKNEGEPDVVVMLPPVWVKPKVAAQSVGGPRNLKILEVFFGLKPVMRHKRNTTYSVDAINRARIRAEAEGIPTPAEIRKQLGS